MRWKLITLALLLASPGAFAGEGIVAVLARSQTDRLAHLRSIDPTSVGARKVRSSFETVVRALGILHLTELRVIAGETVAETLQGRVVVANESLADLTEGERIFVLAHELGHVEMRHWAQTESLYRKWLPGDVVPEQTEPVAEQLGRDASGLAHRQELDADAYALRALRLLGLPMADAVTAFMRLGLTQDTATHPGTRKRLASLRAAEAQWAFASPSPSALASALASAPALASISASVPSLPAAQTTTRNEPIVSARRPD